MRKSRGLLWIILTAASLTASGVAAQETGGRLAIEYGGWEQVGQCRNATATGGRTEIPQIAPGVRQAQECQWRRSVRRCSWDDLKKRFGSCVRGSETRKSTTRPSDDRGRNVG